MKRSVFLTTAGGAFALAGLPALAKGAESEISLATPTGTLFGTLTLPPSTGRCPIVLIVAGSGPTDREGNAPPITGNTYKLLAAALAQRGIASLRYDKRGVGASALAGASESNLRFGTYVADATAWVERLANDKRFSGITIAGHSEGALVGAIAAQRAPVHAFVSLEGSGRPAGMLLREQLHPKLPAALYAQADATLAQLETGHTVPDPPAALAALLRPSVQPYLISWLKYDPAKEIAKVRVPVTIVQGTADAQVTMADANLLKAAAPASTLVVIDGMNHILKHFPDVSSMQAILKGYEDPTLPVEPKVISAVATRAA